MRRRTANKFQGVTVVSDRHGKLRHRLRRTVEGRRIDCYLPGPFGSVEFIAAYEEAMAGARSTAARTATYTVAYLVDRYIASRPFRDLAGTTQSAKLGRMDWIRRMVGDVRYADLEPRHIAALMDKKGGPAAANRLKKDLGQIYRHAAKAAGYTGRNPAALADSHKTDSDGFHTWTDGEIAAYREHHASGTMPRLALEIFLGTGAARQDAAALTRTNIRGGRLTCRRGKTGQAVTVPIVPELAAEISQVPPDRLVLITKRSGRTLSAGTLGRSFGAWCAEGRPCPRNARRTDSATPGLAASPKRAPRNIKSWRSWATQTRPSRRITALPPTGARWPLPVSPSCDPWAATSCPTLSPGWTKEARKPLLGRNKFSDQTIPRGL